VRHFWLVERSYRDNMPPIALKRLMELVIDGGGQLSVVLIGHPRSKNDLRRPKMEEIGDRTTVFEFGGLRPAARLHRLDAQTLTRRERDP
jgi:type II secretory pathway predicted ATPase ExeA